MRENRLYGSEGGAAETNRPSLPLSSRTRQWLIRRSLAAGTSPSPGRCISTSKGMAKSCPIKWQTTPR